MENKLDQIIDIHPWCVKIEDVVKINPHFQKYVDKKGKIDLGDPESLKEYNKAIALALGNLKIEVPNGALIPAVCLRYAYVKILRDQYLSINSKILEIGTGSSAIIALLAAVQGFKVVATEIQLESYRFAKRNIKRNQLEYQINLIKSEGGILKNVIERGAKFDALITYPPVYPDYDIYRFHKNNKKYRGFGGSVPEMIGGGKEGFSFIHQLIDEATSKEFTIDLITILCIFASHVTLVVDLLRNSERFIKVIGLKAGTRTRYLVMGKLTSF